MNKSLTFESLFRYQFRGEIGSSGETGGEGEIKLTSLLQPSHSSWENWHNAGPSRGVIIMSV